MSEEFVGTAVVGDEMVGVGAVYQIAAGTGCQFVGGTGCQFVGGTVAVIVVVLAGNVVAR